MRTLFKHPGPGRKLILKAIVPALTFVVYLAPLAAQSPNQSQTPYWQSAAGGKMAFDVATVKPNKTTPRNAMVSSFPLGPGDVYIPARGQFWATNYPLLSYIEFAYKITDNQEPFLISQLPMWAVTDRFDIQAKVEGNPSKDQMRLMMQSLLADRFRLVVHYELREVPVLALIVDQSGMLGPLLQKHPDESMCATTPMIPSPAPLAPPQFRDTRFPAICGGLLPMTPSVPGLFGTGARNVPMELIASSIGEGEDVDRPVIDKTGLAGMFDFALEFTPQLTASSPPAAKTQRDITGPTLLQALKEQLGLRLEPQTGSIDFLVISSVSGLSPN